MKWAREVEMKRMVPCIVAFEVLTMTGDIVDEKTADQVLAQNEEQIEKALAEMPEWKSFGEITVMMATSGPDQSYVGTEYTINWGIVKGKKTQHIVHIAVPVETLPDERYCSLDCPYYRGTGDEDSYGYLPSCVALGQALQKERSTNRILRCQQCLDAQTKIKR